MIKVQNPNASKKAIKDFDKYPESGLTSYIYLDSPELWSALNRIFRVKETEEIAGITIKDGMIKAKIEYK